MPAIIGIKMKICRKCKTSKPIDCFSRHARTPDGLRSHCKDCQREMDKEKYIKNRFDIITKITLYNKTQSAKSQRNFTRKIRRKRDVGFRIEDSLRARVKNAIKRNSKSGSTKNLIGCDSQTLKSHLESKFTTGMTWENYGLHGWHIDHIRPCASFDLSIPEEQRKCFHYTNLQPLWAVDNLSKSDRLIY